MIAVHGLAGLVGGADAAELLDSPGIVVDYRERKSKSVNISALITQKKIAKRHIRNQVVIYLTVNELRYVSQHAARNR